MNQHIILISTRHFIRVYDCLSCLLDVRTCAAVVAADKEAGTNSKNGICGGGGGKGKHNKTDREGELKMSKEYLRG